MILNDTFTISVPPKVRKVVIHCSQNDIVIYTLRMTKTQIHLEAYPRKETQIHLDTYPKKGKREEAEK